MTSYTFSPPLLSSLAQAIVKILANLSRQVAPSRLHMFGNEILVLNALLNVVFCLDLSSQFFG